MIGFSIVYPLEKKQKLELEVNNYNQHVEILNRETSKLLKNAQDLEIVANNTVKILEGAESDPDKSISKNERKVLQDSFNVKYNRIKLLRTELSTNDVILKYEKNRILLLRKHIKSFNCYKNMMFWLGLGFLLFGLYMWLRVTCTAIKMQKSQLENLNIDKKKLC